MVNTFLAAAEGDKLKLVIRSKMFFSDDFAFCKSERESPLSIEVFELYEGKKSVHPLDKGFSTQNSLFGSVNYSCLDILCSDPVVGKLCPGGPIRPNE